MKFTFLAILIIISFNVNCQKLYQLYGNWRITQPDSLDINKLNSENIGFVYSQIMTAKNVDYISIYKKGFLLLISSNSKAPNYAFSFTIDRRLRAIVFHVVSYKPKENESFSIKFIHKDLVELTNQYNSKIILIRK